MKKTAVLFLALFAIYCGAVASETNEKKMTADSYYSRGALRFSRGEYKDALNDLTIAVTMQPKHYRAWTLRGAAYDRIADQESRTDCSEAMADFSNAIKLNPRFPDPYFYRGYRLYMASDYKAALSDLNKVIELDPDDAGSYYNRALIYKKLHKSKEARHDYDTALRLGFKGQDLFGESGGQIGIFFLVCVVIFMIVFIAIIAVIIRRGNLSDQVRPLD